MNWQATLTATCFRIDQVQNNQKLEVAFVGRSNVGKSSLINKLINQKLAHVSSKPGKTRSLNFFDVRCQTPFTLVDLPGFGYASRGKSERDSWARLIHQYLFNRDNLALLIHLVDIRHGLLGTDYIFQEWAKDLSCPLMVVFTKADKLPVTKRKSTVLNYLKGGLRSWDVPIICSIQDSASIEKLRSFIELYLQNLEKERG